MVARCEVGRGMGKMGGGDGETPAFSFGMNTSQQ